MKGNDIMNVKHVNRKEILFPEAKSGDVIEYNGDYYLKITTLVNGENAVNVYDGFAITINDDEYVFIVDSELTIK